MCTAFFYLDVDLYNALQVVIPSIRLINFKLSGSEPGTMVWETLKTRFLYPNKIILTSAATPDTAVLQSSLADDFIAKPFDLEEILNNVQGHLLS